MDTIEFLTQDDVHIAAHYWRGSAPRAIILLHMMPATKESWRGFAERLHDAGWSVLAIDLRGHGQSRRGGLDYRKFSDAGHQAKFLDVLAARQWLIDHEATAPAEIRIGGASIGANLAIQYLASREEARAAFALSPGLNYRGVEAASFTERLGHDKKLFLAAAEDDSRSSQAVLWLEKMGEADTRVMLYKTGGHGTELLNAHPELTDELITWLNN